MVEHPVFKGGTLRLNCKGIGLGEWLFRRLPRGPWVRVVVRERGQKAEAKADMAALDYILKHKEAKVRSYLDNAVYYDKHKATVKTMSAAQFLASYGGVK